MHDERVHEDQRPAACRKAAGRVVDRAYGELSAKASRLLDQHLSQCASCTGLAAQTASLAQVAPGDPAVDDLLAPRVLLAARTLRVREAVRSAVAWGGRAALALSMALACTQAVRQGPGLAHLPTKVSWLVLVAWTVLLAWLLDRLLDRDNRVKPVHAPLSGRAVAYGVLASVGLSLALVGTFFVFCRNQPFRAMGLLPDSFSLLSAGALLLVGLAMGAKLGRESSPNMLAVVVLYGSIMVPALVRGAPTLLPDVFHLLCLVAMWGLSGAYLGSVIAGSRDIETPRTASL